MMTDEDLRSYLEQQFRKTDQLIDALSNRRRSPLEGITTLLAVAGMIASAATTWGGTAKRMDYMEDSIKSATVKADQVPIILSKVDALTNLLNEIKTKQGIDSDKLAEVRTTLAEIGLQIKPPRHQ